MSAPLGGQSATAAKGLASTLVGEFGCKGEGLVETLDAFERLAKDAAYSHTAEVLERCVGDLADMETRRRVLGLVASLRTYSVVAPSTPPVVDVMYRRYVAARVMAALYGVPSDVALGPLDTVESYAHKMARLSWQCADALIATESEDAT